MHVRLDGSVTPDSAKERPPRWGREREREREREEGAPGKMTEERGGEREEEEEEEGVDHYGSFSVISIITLKSHR